MMKMRQKRIFALIMALVMMLSLSPVSFADDEDILNTPGVSSEQTDELSIPAPGDETDGTDIAGEIPETPEDIAEDVEPVQEEDGEVPEDCEDPAEETIPEEDADCEDEESAGADPVRTVFSFEEKYVLNVASSEGEDIQAAENTYESEDGAFLTEYLLLPGEYFYSVRAVGFYELKIAPLTVTGEQEELSVEIEMEAYPYGIKGMPLDYALSDEEMAQKAEIAEFVLPQLDSFIPGEDYEDGQLVFLAESEEYAQAVAESYSAELIDFESDIAVIKLDGMTVCEAVSAAADSSIPVVAADPNYIVTLVEPEEEIATMSVFSAGPHDTYSPNQTWRDWVEDTDNPDPYVDDPDEERYQYFHDVIDTFEAWGYTTGSPDIKVLVLDSGIDPSHSDVSAVETSYYEGSDFTSSDDGLGHGTHCAGIIGADMGNGIGGAGVAPGVSLYVYKCLKDDGKGGDANIMAGISWGIEKGVDIISMSLGGYAYNTAYRAKVQEAIDAGITVVAAVGNDGANVKCYPAGYDIQGLIAVQATDSNNNIAKYSNYGSWADISAPGTGVWSTWKNDGYRSQNGTSMATPVVAGSCALYMSLYGHTSPAAMESTVKSTAVDGIVNVYNMLRPSEPAPDASVELSVIDCDGRDITEEAESTHEIKNDSYLVLTGTDAELMIYTLDGTEPSFNGETAVNGTVYADSPIALADMTPEDEITVKAAGVNADGVMGGVTEFTFTLKDARRYYSAVNVYGVSLSKTALSCTYNTPGSENLAVTASFRDRNKKRLDYEADGIVCRWESSNEAVFTPADNGDGSCTLQVNGPGKAYLTCTALNSNGVKTAKCTVNVYQCVTDIEITGFETVAAGKTCTYRATVNSDAKKKSVVWSLEDVPEGRSTRINSSGYLKTADAQPGDIFTVKAEAKDGSGTCCSMQVLITEPVSKIMIEPGSGTQGMSQKYDRYGSLTAASISTIDIEGSGREDSVLILQPVYVIDGERADEGAKTVWTSSNRKVAAVDPETGIVTAAGPGKTTITGTLQDASNKKAVVTVSVKAPAEAIEISGHSCLTAGKLVNLKATFTPVKPSVTKVNWRVDSIEYPDGIQKGKVSIDKLRGTVRATADVPVGTVIAVRAEAADGYGALSEAYLLTVTPPVSSVAISAAAQSCGYDTLYRYGSLYSAKMLCPGIGGYSEMNVRADVLDKRGNAVDCPVTWKSSNPRVASVAGTGTDAVVTATGKGSARITATTDDSSAKSVSFTVRVSKPVESISIASDAFTNRDGLYKVTGGGAVFRAKTNPADADITGVNWKIEPVGGVSTSGIRINSSGVVTVDSSVRSGIVFKVTATAKDAGGVSASATAVTGRSVQSVVLTPGTNRGAVTGYNSIGSVSWAVLHTLDTVPDEGITKTEMDLSYRLCQDKYGRVALPDSEVDFDVIWGSSDENVVTVDGNGTLRAVNPGRATVYCKALDGNGVTASVDVEVDIPASSIELKPGIRASSSGEYEIGTAAEIHNGVALGGLYGKPTCRYFNWSAVLVRIDSKTDEETEIDASAYISIDSDGTLKVRSGIRSLLDFSDDNYIVVTVSTTDGTELTDAVEYHINPPVTSITARTKTLNKNKTTLTTVYADVVSSYDVSSYMFDAVTDNPDVAGGMINASKSTGSEIAVSVYTGGTAGMAHITVKAKDGSEAQCVITVNVSD